MPSSSRTAVCCRRKRRNSAARSCRRQRIALPLGRPRLLPGGRDQCTSDPDRRRRFRRAVDLRRPHPDPRARQDRCGRSSIHGLPHHGSLLAHACSHAHGRNHHSAGTGNISEMSSGFPGYNSIIPPEKATVAQTLRLNGYSTAWFGKNTISLRGKPIPSARSAIGLSAWASTISSGSSAAIRANGSRATSSATQTPIHPYVGRKDWNLGNRDGRRCHQPHQDACGGHAQPSWFIHYAPGGTHAPHQPPKRWIETFKGKFDAGWERLPVRSSTIRRRWA